MISTRLPVPTDKPIVPVLMYHSQSPPCRPPDDDIPQDIIFAKDFICTQIANMAGLYATRSPLRMFCYNMLAYHHFENEHFRAVYQYVCGYLLFKQRKRLLLDLRMTTVECIHQVLAMYTAYFCNNYSELMNLLTEEQIVEISRLTVEFEDIKNMTRSVFEACAKQSQQEYADNLKDILFKCKDLYVLSGNDLEQDCHKVHRASLEEPIVLSNTLKNKQSNPLQIKPVHTPRDFDVNEVIMNTTLYPPTTPVQPIHHQPQAMLHPRDQAMYNQNSMQPQPMGYPQQVQQPVQYVQGPQPVNQGYPQQIITAPPGTQLVTFADGSQGFVPLPQGPTQQYVNNPNNIMVQQPQRPSMGLQSAFNAANQQYQQPLQSMQNIWIPDLPVVGVVATYGNGTRDVQLPNGSLVRQQLTQVPMQSRGEQIADAALGTSNSSFTRPAQVIVNQDKPLNTGFDRYGSYAANIQAREQREREQQQQTQLSREEEMRLDYERRHGSTMTVEEQRAEEQRQYDERRQRDEEAKRAHERHEAEKLNQASQWSATPDVLPNASTVQYTSPGAVRYAMDDGPRYPNDDFDDVPSAREQNLIKTNPEDDRLSNIRNSVPTRMPIVGNDTRVIVAGGMTEAELARLGYVKQNATSIQDNQIAYEDANIDNYANTLYKQVMDAPWPDEVDQSTTDVLTAQNYPRSEPLFPEDILKPVPTMDAQSLNIVRRTPNTHPESFIPLTPVTYAGENEMERSEHQIVRFGGAVRYALKPKFEAFEQGVAELVASPMVRLPDIIETDELTEQEIITPALDKNEYAVYPNTLAEKSMDDAIFGSRLLKMEHMKATPDAKLFRTFAIVSDLIVSTADIQPMVQTIKESKSFGEMATALRKAVTYPFADNEDRIAAGIVLQEIDRKIVTHVNRFLKYKLNVSTTIDEAMDLLELRAFLVNHFSDSNLGLAFDRFEKEFIECLGLQISEEDLDDTKAKACISPDLFVAYMPISATFTHVNLNYCDVEIATDLEGQVAFIKPEDHPNLYRLIANIDANKQARKFISLEDYLITADGVCFRVYVNYTNGELYLLERV